MRGPGREPSVIERCYCVFEGGGARGIAHLGALRALEKSDLTLCGFAGTSAGAIVAALAAAGYSSAEMFGETGSLLDRLDMGPDWNRAPIRTPTRLLGPGGWQGIRLARAASQWSFPLFVGPLGLLLVLTEIALLTGKIGWVVILALWTTMASVVAVTSYAAAGLADLRSFVDALDQALAQKLPGLAGRRATFADLEEAGRPPLKMVAANVSGRKLELFSSRTTPHVAVADAVAASICLPVIFGPHAIDEALHFDGGIVSNLPVWSFDEERMLDRDAATVAVQITDTKPNGPVKPGLGAIGAAAKTALSGADLLDKRGVDRLFLLHINPPVGLLDFDVGRDAVTSMVDAAERQANARLVTRMIDRERLMERLCELVAARVLDTLNISLAKLRLNQLSGRVRCALFIPEFPNSGGTPLTLRNGFNWGYDDCADDRLRVPAFDSISGRALAQGSAIFIDGKPALEQAAFRDARHRWLRAIIWPNQQWCLAVPFSVTIDRQVVVFVDGDDELKLPLEAMDDGFYALLSREVQTILKDKLAEDIFDDDRKDQEPSAV